MRDDAEKQTACIIAREREREERRCWPTNALTRRDSHSSHSFRDADEDEEEEIEGGGGGKGGGERKRRDERCYQCDTGAPDRLSEVRMHTNCKDASVVN